MTAFQLRMDDKGNLHNFIRYRLAKCVQRALSFMLNSFSSCYHADKVIV